MSYSHLSDSDSDSMQYTRNTKSYHITQKRIMMSTGREHIQRFIRIDRLYSKQNSKQREYKWLLDWGEYNTFVA